MKGDDRYGEVLHSWSGGTQVFEPGIEFRYLGPIENMPALEPGQYTINVELDGMATWHKRSAQFVVEE